MKRFFAKHTKKLSVSTVLVAICALCSVLVCHWQIKKSTEPYLYESVNDLPYNRVGLVLGTSQYLRKGVPNPYFQYRMEAAARLYHARKISYILLSGDNSTIYYNEPIAMRKALLKLGVPKDRIYLDFAGFRTLDSVVRCKEVFGQTKFTIISQSFHNERALYISRQAGCQTVAYNAQDVSLAHGVRVQTRELFARVKALLDVHVTHQRPKFLGESIVIH